MMAKIKIKINKISYVNIIFLLALAYIFGSCYIINAFGSKTIETYTFATEILLF